MAARLAPNFELAVGVMTDPRGAGEGVAARGDAPEEEYEGGRARDAEQRLFEAVYDELRRMARHRMRGERPGHTLSPTALVHEAYLKLVDASRISWQGRTHFFAVGANMMRRILVDLPDGLFD